MKQLSLYECCAVALPQRPERSDEELEVYDYFAGAGGFSTGAAQAGCCVAYVCDACPKALATHRRNHKHARHECARLPNAGAVAQLPTDGRRFHVHCSPPCTKLSSINNINTFERRDSAAKQQKAIDMVEWSLNMMLASRCTSWSLEQVVSPDVIAALKRARRTHPGQVAWVALDFVLLGVPQNRVRLVAGTPRLIARLQRLCGSAHRSTVRDVLPNARGTHLRSGKSIKKTRLRTNRKPGQTKYMCEKATWSDNCRSIDKPAPTVRGRHAHTWVTIHKGAAPAHAVLSPASSPCFRPFRLTISCQNASLMRTSK